MCHLLSIIYHFLHSLITMQHEIQQLETDRQPQTNIDRQTYGRTNKHKGKGAHIQRKRQGMAGTQN